MTYITRTTERSDKHNNSPRRIYNLASQNTHTYQPVRNLQTDTSPTLQSCGTTHRQGMWTRQKKESGISTTYGKHEHDGGAKLGADERPAQTKKDFFQKAAYPFPYMTASHGHNGDWTRTRRTTTHATRRWPVEVEETRTAFGVVFVLVQLRNMSIFRHTHHRGNCTSIHSLEQNSTSKDNAYSIYCNLRNSDIFYATPREIRRKRNTWNSKTIHPVLICSIRIHHHLETLARVSSPSYGRAKGLGIFPACPTCDDFRPNVPPRYRTNRHNLCYE